MEYRTIPGGEKDATGFKASRNGTTSSIPLNSAKYYGNVFGNSM